MEHRVGGENEGGTGWGGVEEEKAKCLRKGILQILEGQKNDSPGQRVWNGDNSTALSYSRLGPLILQDLQATVQCVPVFVCLQALQDTRGPESLAANPSGVLVSTFSVPDTYLHPGLDHIQRRVPKDTGCTSNGAKDPGDQWVHRLVGIVSWIRVQLQSEHQGRSEGGA